MPENEPQWEDVTSPRVGDYTERLKVPGGWLYRNWFTNPDNSQITLALIFVPNPQ